MALDDKGNDRIDFVWGNIPMQRNYSNEDETTFRVWWSNYPGDGEAEYYLKGHATQQDLHNQFGYPWDAAANVSPGTFLSGLDSEEIALRQWNNFPYNDPDTGFNLFVNWWENGLPAFEFPNIIGLSEADAIQALKNLGVNPATLVPTEFDAPDAFKYIGYDSNTDTLYDPVNAPGADVPGVIAYRYYQPDDIIGYHWDGTPWLAKESEGKVLYTSSWVGEPVAVGDYPGDYSWWHSFVVINTTKPAYDSYQWWNY